MFLVKLSFTVSFHKGSPFYFNDTENGRGDRRTKGAGN
jgi:hypothetical protein